MHPDYLSTKYALEREGVEHLAVQHHHAHLAACLAEHGETGPAIGAIYDGTGYGPDGTIWGGELLAGGVGRLRAGRDAVARHGCPAGPRRSASRGAWRARGSWPRPGRSRAAASRRRSPAAVEPAAWSEVCELVKTGVASPPTTSMGRLFDALAAICGLRPRVSYEGQAAVELEAAADLDERGAYPLPIDRRWRAREMVLLDVREMVGAVRDDAAADAPVATISARVHNALAGHDRGSVCRRGRAPRESSSPCSPAGVFQNRLLLERTLDALSSSGPAGARPARPAAQRRRDQPRAGGGRAAASPRLDRRAEARVDPPSRADALADSAAPPPVDLTGCGPIAQGWGPIVP